MMRVERLSRCALGNLPAVDQWIPVITETGRAEAYNLMY